MNVQFSVVRSICEFRVLQFLGLAEVVAVCAEGFARRHEAQNYVF